MISVVRKLAQECARPSCAVFLAVAGSTLLSGCTPQDYELGQRIEMGPFAFHVEGASSGVNRGYEGGPMREITVRLRLLSNESRPRKDFYEFLTGIDPYRLQLIVLPHYKLEDSHGHKFDGLMTRCTDTCRIEFHIRGDLRVMRMFSSDEAFREEHFDLRPEDFRLIITNPDRRDGQPSEVSIQL